ncbi:hypothetical protein K504DRAFT_456466 [Pleomassaria siparia CBS 279.74]|uniref:Uncharacterized protein n=1 Tax=Pleomassaria siparia CBS 279.74 TaxID=1314801 RepID=A0A6G1K6M9_9PLEO|nr:hypothetical protein K504DRAFT_456466 [Pleomassaria siparia CBS 279.74]
MPSRFGPSSSRHGRSTSTKQRRPCNGFKPLPPLPKFTHLLSQRLPCGCPRLQSSPYQDTDDELLDLYPEQSPVFSASAIPSTSTSLHGEIKPTSEDWPYTGRFHYYLPRISSRSNDVYTSDTHAAYDICTSCSESSSSESSSSENSSTNAESDSSGFQQDLKLPWINDDDFQYYPRSDMGAQESLELERTNEKTPIIEDESRGKRSTKKKKKKEEEGRGFRLDKVVYHQVTNEVQPIIKMGFHHQGSAYMCPARTQGTKLWSPSPLSAGLPSVEYAALRGRQRIEKLYEKRVSTHQNGTSSTYEPSPPRYAHVGGGSAYRYNCHNSNHAMYTQKFKPSQEGRLKTSEIRYATRKALLSSPNTQHSYEYMFEDTCEDYTDTMREDTCEDYDDTMREDRWEDYDDTTRDYAASEHQPIYANNDDVIDMVLHVEQYQQSINPLATRSIQHMAHSENAATSRPVLQSRFSWDDSDSDEEEEGKSRRSMFGNVKRWSKDSGYSSAQRSPNTGKSFGKSLKKGLCKCIHKG